MSFQPNKQLTDRVERAALALLARDGRLTYPTLLRELGILSPRDLEAWRGGRVPFLEKVTRANLTKLGRIQTAVRRLARAHGLQRRIVHAPRGRRYSKSRHPFVEEEYGAVYTTPGRTVASRIPRDVAAAIQRCWPGGIVSEFASDESYFGEIHAPLERDLRNIRGASLRWRTQDEPPAADLHEDDELPPQDEWQSYDVFFLALDDEVFHFISETTDIEEREDPPGEETESVYSAEGWIGWTVGISLAAPYAVTNLSSYSCSEDGTMSIPDVESFIYSTQQRVDTVRYHREMVGREAFQKLEALRVQIAAILTKSTVVTLPSASDRMPRVSRQDLGQRRSGSARARTQGQRGRLSRRTAASTGCLLLSRRVSRAASTSVRPFPIRRANPLASGDTRRCDVSWS